MAGLPVARRLVLAATSAGYARIFTDERAVDAASLEGTAACRWPETIPLASVPQRLVLVPANLVVQRRWLRDLLDAPLEPETLYIDGSLAAVVETKRVPEVLAAARAGDAADVLERLRGTFDAGTLPADGSGVRPLASAADVVGAESWLLQSLIKRNEGFMSRHVERRISLTVTRRLVATPVTPNMMTLVSVAIGLLGAPWFLSSAPACQVTGALLFLAHSILDGCDGELARLKFLESHTGALLDFWGDNVVHVAVFAAIAIGWSWRAGAAWPLGLGTSAIAGTLASATLMFRHFVEDRAIAGAWSERMATALASRDFIYVVVVLSALGLAHWFLIVGSVGTPAFGLFALYLGVRRGPVR